MAGVKSSPGHTPQGSELSGVFEVDLFSHWALYVKAALIDFFKNASVFLYPDSHHYNSYSEMRRRRKKIKQAGDQQLKFEHNWLRYPNRQNESGRKHRLEGEQKTRMPTNEDWLTLQYSLSVHCSRTLK